MKVKEMSEKVGLKLNIQKAKIMASSPITSWQIGKQWEQWQTLFSWAPKSLQMVHEGREPVVGAEGPGWGLGASRAWKHSPGPRSGEPESRGRQIVLEEQTKDAGGCRPPPPGTLSVCLLREWRPLE